MHGVVVHVTLGDVDVATKALHEQVVPRVKQAPGFVTAYWLRKDNSGISMLIFESEDAANAAAEQVKTQGAPSEAVTLDDVEVREVVAHA
jgi:hypothetical protein